MSITLIHQFHLLIIIEIKILNMDINIDLEYSIVICSYNPDERIMRRCLNAIRGIDFQDIRCEVILVDNNSQPKLKSLSYIQDFLNNTPNSRCIVEKKQGLVHARIKGIEEASGNYIMFFDDDNEPYVDYLVNLKKLHADYPTVVAWGPGNIWVDFIDGFDKSISSNTQEYARVGLFQERHMEFTTYGNNRAWESYYPYGTGMSVKRSYLVDYSQKVKRAEYNAVGRSGKSLSSGEDLQIVLFCINELAAAGISPTLKVNHIISGKRANMDYMKKLMFAVSVSYHKCTDEMLMEYREKLVGTNPSVFQFVFKTVFKCVRDLLSNNQIRTLGSLKSIGLDYGHYITINKSIPRIVKKVLKVYGIKPGSLPL